MELLQSIEVVPVQSVATPLIEAEPLQFRLKGGCC